MSVHGASASLPKSKFDSYVLRPYSRLEAISLDEAAEEAGVCRATIRNWSTKFGIGRAIATRFMVSRVALAMLLDDDEQALTAYLEGDRSSADVTAYYGRLGIPTPPSSATAS